MLLIGLVLAGWTIVAVGVGMLLGRILQERDRRG